MPRVSIFSQVSPDERVLLRLLAVGQSPAQAASVLDVTPDDIEARLKILQTRMRVSGLPSLLTLAAVRGLL